MQKALLVVAALLATMSYQASITPPGGFWQDDRLDNTTDAAPAPKPHDAGQSIMADKSSTLYEAFVACNTTSFIASLSVILLLISGLPLKRHRCTTWLAMLTLWVAITFMALTYAISVLQFTPDRNKMNALKIVGYGVMAWAGLMALIFLCHFVRLILKLVRKVLKLVRKVLKLVCNACTGHRPDKEQKKYPEP